MKRVRILFCNLLLGLTAINVNAQLVQDIAGVSVTVNATNKFKDVPTSSELNDNKFNLKTYAVWLPMAPLNFGKTRIFSNINYRYFDFNFKNDTSKDPFVIDKISEIRSQIIVISPISKRLSILAITTPTVASDFKGAFSSDNIILDGIYGISRKFGKNANLEIGFGVHLMYSFGEFMVTPGISVDYRSTDKKWVAQFYWPRLNILRNISKNTQFGFAASIDWTKYNLKNYTDFQGNQIDYAQYSTIRSGIQFNQKLFGSVWLQLQGGVGFANSYKLYDSKNESVRDFGFDTKPYGRLTLSYRIK